MDYVIYDKSTGEFVDFLSFDSIKDLKKYEESHPNYSLEKADIENPFEDDYYNDEDLKWTS